MVAHLGLERVLGVGVIVHLISMSLGEGTNSVGRPETAHHWQKPTFLAVKHPRGSMDEEARGEALPGIPDPSKSEKRIGPSARNSLRPQATRGCWRASPA